MAAGGFGFQGIRKFVRSALTALRAPEPVVFEEYRPSPPPELRLAAGEPPALPPETDMRGAGWVAFAVSVAIHGGILAYVLTHRLVDGGLSPSADAPVSVELVDSRVFEVTADGKQTEAAPAPAAPPSAPSAPAPAPAEPATTAALIEDKQAAQPAQPQPIVAEAPSPGKVAAASPREAPAAEPAPPVLAVPDTHTSETVAPEPPTAKATATPFETETKPASQTSRLDAKDNPKPAAKAKTEHRKRERHASLGSHASAGESGDEARAARKSASRGAGLSYRNLVMAHLSAHRPSSSPVSGTVKVAFTLSLSGQVVSAHISQSSGKPELDRKALGAVRSASPYPSPPSGLSVSQRSFNMPFYFK